MYKSKLQEFCQSKKWKLPEYSTTREGVDHCPQFQATVVVNGSAFTTPHSSKSSKEAQNLVAQIAFEHLYGSSGAGTGLQVSPTFIGAQQPQPLQVSSSSEVNSPNRDDKKVKDMAHLYKNQLQIYAQKRNLNLPEYKSEREGPPHAAHFKSKVILEGKTYESLEYFSTVKDAENAAAKAALMSVASYGTAEEDPGFFKNLLQELAQREYSCLPAYSTTRSGPSHNPIFVSTVEINEESFTGQEAKTKKLAEMYAAKVAYTALRERAYHQGNETNHTVVEPEVSANLGQSNCGQKVDALPFRLDSSHSPNASAPFQFPFRSEAKKTSQPSASSDASSSHKKIKVYPLTSNMTLPAGATVMLKDDKWVAMTMDSINGNL